MSYILSLDQGTSSSRSIIFTPDGRIVALAQKEFTQHFPQSGWVEHDPLEIWTSQLHTTQQALNKAGLSASDIRAIGITNQRETTLVWDKNTGTPQYPAIVWQDRRTHRYCQALHERGYENTIQLRTGLTIDPYFSATKLRWILDSIPNGQQRAEAGELAFGTIDAWLLWQLTEGRLHATDFSNAARTLLFNIHNSEWDAELLSLFDIPHAMLPSVHPSSYYYGDCSAQLFGSAIPIHGVAGDQQAALFGQACFTAGMTKNTYGTGCFMLMHTGEHAEQSTSGLITTRAAQATHTAQYALEGSVFIGGAVVQWLRDGLQAIEASHEVEALADSVDGAEGVIMVPAFTGLGAPYWKPNARGSILGISRGTTIAHIAHAALESIAFQCTALFQAMQSDSQHNQTAIHELRVDGGASRNDKLMQIQADLLGLEVVRPAMTETTALGAAYLAGLSAGVYKDTSELEAQWQVERRFYPRLRNAEREERMQRWEHAIKQTCL